MCPSGRNLHDSSYSPPPPSLSYPGAGTFGFRTAFDVLDADRDGKISRDDLRTFFSGFVPSAAANGEESEIGPDEDDVIGSMMTVADFNNDGFVEYEEFERILLGGSRNGVKSPLDFGVMEDVFRVMDKDGDGRLTQNDLKSYMESAGFSTSDEEIKAMIKLGGGENNGVTLDGLLKILAV